MVSRARLDSADRNNIPLTDAQEVCKEGTKENLTFFVFEMMFETLQVTQT